MPATTSGIVSGVKVTVRQIMDHAFRRAGILPARVSSEALTTAIELLYSLQTEWAAVGYPLWTKVYSILPITAGSGDVPTPVGTVDMIQAFWRIIMPFRGPSFLTNGAADNLLFGGQPNADVVVPGPNPSVGVSFGGMGELDTVGVLLGGNVPVTAALNVQTSPDLATWTTVQTLPSLTYTPMVWTYTDLNPVIIAPFVRVQLPGAGPWMLNQLQFGLPNWQDIKLGDLSEDDFYNLTNRDFKTNQPNSVYNDRTLNGPVLQIYPFPDQAAFYNGTVTALTRRYIMDPGSMTNILEIPQYWIEATQWRLAVRIMDEIPEEMLVPGTQPPLPTTSQDREARYVRVTKNAEKAEAIAWGENRNKAAPARLIPSLRAYTA